MEPVNCRNSCYDNGISRILTGTAYQYAESRGFCKKRTPANVRGESASSVFGKQLGCEMDLTPCANFS